MKKNEKTEAVQQQNEQAYEMPYEMRMHGLGDGKTYLARLSVTLGDSFAVRGVRLVEGNTGPFLSFPSVKTAKGYSDVCFPVSAELRQRMTESAMGLYHQALQQHREQKTAAPDRDAQQEAPEEMTGQEPDDPGRQMEMGMQMG